MSFEVIPAIDISEGKVVRLTRGEMDQKTVYADDPREVARRWIEFGAQRIHVVDLDATVKGETRNEPLIGDIVAESGVPVQLGGGLRSLDAIASWIEAGVDRVVLGTIAFTEPPVLKTAIRAFGEHLVVGADYRDGEIRVSGWTQSTGLEVVETAKVLADIGVKRLLCTDISRDGTLEGPDTDLLAQIAEASGIGVIASGGVGNVGHIRALLELAGSGVEGVVVGRALYTGDADPSEAIGLSC